MYNYNKVTFKEFVSFVIRCLKTMIENVFWSKGGKVFWKILKFCTMVMIIAISGIMVYVFGSEVLGLWDINKVSCEDSLGYGVYYAYSRPNKHRGRIGNITDKDGKIYVKDVTKIWQEKEDSIIVFERKEFRGYMNLKSRKVMVPPRKYTEAYVYREGRAMVMTRDSIFVLDEMGKEIGNAFARTGGRNTDMNCFHHGYLPMVGENGKMGLIDMEAKWVVDPEYDNITFALSKYWVFRNMKPSVGPELEYDTTTYAKILDDSLKTVIDQECTYVWISSVAKIIVADKDHWQRRYDFDGTLIEDFVCESIELLQYPTGEKKWIDKKDYDSYYGTQTTVTEEIAVSAIATLEKYRTSNGWFGLISKDGKIITSPRFRNIKAIGKDLYLCSYDDDSEFGVLLTEKGTEVGKR